jgi:hypothetical protein
MSPIFFCFFILAAQFVMLNLVVAVLMKELGDAEKADAEEQAALAEGGKTDADESTSVEYLGSGSKRRSLDETMNEGAKYWSKRFSDARKPNNVMYDFPDDSGKNVETIVVDKTVVEGEESEMVPMQTGQTSTAPGTPDRIAGGESAGVAERPPTRSAWGQ